MEVVSGAFAVVSLSIQLIQSVTTIKAFIQNVKQAPTEFKRIVWTLDALESHIKEVQDVLKKQASHFGPDYSVPSGAIISSLRRCEDHLRPLKKIVDEYGPTARGDASRRAKLWDNLTLAMKRTEISTIRDDIHQEMTLLTAALDLNTIRVQSHFFPILAREQRTLTTTLLQYLVAPPAKYRTDVEDHPRQLECPQYFLERTYTEKRIEMPSILERFGVRRHKKVRLPLNNCKRSAQHHEEGTIIWEEDVFSWNAKLLRLGLQWIRNSQYGHIFPALRTYPVFPWFSDMHKRCQSLIESGSIDNVRVAIQTGNINRFMRFEDGTTLLHLAAYYARADICHLLVTSGLGAELDDSGSSPFRRILESIQIRWETDEAVIDTMRVLLRTGDELEELNRDPVLLSCPLYLWADDAVGNWLLRRVTSGFSYLSLRDITNLMVEIVCEGVTEYVDKTGLVEILQHFLGKHSIYQQALDSLACMDAVFEKTQSEIESFAFGKDWLQILSYFELDIEAYLRKQLEGRPGGLLQSISGKPERKLLIDHTAHDGWRLGWEWIHDPTAPGFLAVAEFSIIANLEVYLWVGPSSWPCPLYYFTEEMELRYMNTDECVRRRIERRERWAQKELKRSELKKTGSTMPGSWIE